LSRRQRPGARAAANTITETTSPPALDILYIPRIPPQISLSTISPLPLCHRHLRATSNAHLTLPPAPRHAQLFWCHQHTNTRLSACSRIMFRNRTSSQKPNDQLYSEFLQKFPDIRTASSSSGDGNSGSNTLADGAGPVESRQVTLSSRYPIILLSCCPQSVDLLEHRKLTSGIVSRAGKAMSISKIWIPRPGRSTKLGDSRLPCWM